jgi:uncharacterized Zn-finger protein
MNKDFSATYNHIFKQAEKFMCEMGNKDVRKTWTTPQKRTWILRIPHCPICEEKFTVETVSREHIFPLVLGGRESDDNIIPLCQPCNKNRNDLMTICIGSRSLVTLRKRWPANKTSIEEFLVWCHATISQERETVETFQHLNETFSKLRKIKNKYSSKASKPQKSLFTRGKEWFQNKRNNVSKRPVKTEKISITCIGENCAKLFKIPRGYEGGFKCPYCRLAGHYSSTKLTFESPNKMDLRTPNTTTPTLKRKNNDVKNEDKKIQKNQFDLNLWLLQNWNGLESASSTYVELKLAISAHEKMNQKRAVRMVLHKDYGLQETLPLPKIFQRLDDLYNSGKRKNDSDKKRIIQDEQKQDGQYDFVERMRYFLGEEDMSMVKLGKKIRYWQEKEGWKEFGTKVFLARCGLKTSAGLMKTIKQKMADEIEITGESSNYHIKVKKKPQPKPKEKAKQKRVEKPVEAEQLNFVEIIRTLLSDGKRRTLANLGKEISLWQKSKGFDNHNVKDFLKKCGLSRTSGLLKNIRELMADEVEITGDEPPFTIRMLK